jgi:hypothetical protein
MHYDTCYLAENYNIIQVPVLSDNYSYLLCDTKTGEAFAVDPAEPAKARTYYWSYDLLTL